MPFRGWVVGVSFPMGYASEQGHPQYPLMCIFVLGDFTLQWLGRAAQQGGEPQYEPLTGEVWGSRAPALTMLKILLCRLMTLLEEQGRWQEALLLYQQSLDVMREEQNEPATYTRELAHPIRQGLVLRERGNGYVAARTRTASPLLVGTQGAHRIGREVPVCTQRVQVTSLVARWSGQRPFRYHLRPRRRLGTCPR
jgi:hypothetical protein